MSVTETTESIAVENKRQEIIALDTINQDFRASLRSLIEALENISLNTVECNIELKSNFDVVRDHALQLQVLSEQLRQAENNFINMLSHELRSPLMVMLLWIEIIKINDIDLAKISHGIKVIEKNVLIQNELINELLDRCK